MFTGLIEEVGVIQSFQLQGETATIEIQAQKVTAELREGDSIAVNGTCLTVTGSSPKSFLAELSQETLARTNLGRVQPGNRVNLERPLLPTSRLGGHFVQGHVDGIARVTSIHADGRFALYEFRFPSELRHYIVEKGSIAVDGISLTVAKLDKHSFQVAIIPHTLNNTNLPERQVGDSVNLECDILAKYVEALSNRQKESDARPPLTLQYLKDQGY
jgi:riboflavin synthase